MAYIETDSSYSKENQEKHLKQFNKIDWEKAIGMRIIGKDNLDMGKLIKTTTPKETIYKIDKENLYTIWTSMGSYTGHTGHGP